MMNSIYMMQKRLGSWREWSREDMVYLLNEVRIAHLDGRLAGQNDHGLVAEALAIAIVAMEMGRTEEGIAEITSKVSRVRAVRKDHDNREGGPGFFKGFFG